MPPVLKQIYEILDGGEPPPPGLPEFEWYETLPDKIIFTKTALNL